MNKKNHISILHFTKVLPLIFMFCLLFAGLKSFSEKLGKTITISQKNASLSFLFVEIHKQTGYFFYYNEVDLESAHKIDINVVHASLDEVLLICFKDQPLSFEVNDQTIIVKAKGDIRTVTDISGQVTDEQGRAISGATITLRDGMATSTDQQGYFKFYHVPEKQTVTVSNVGYESKTVSVTFKSPLLIQLKRFVSKLDDIQIIAYGTTTRRLNTGDINMIKSDVIEEQPVGNALAALEGRAPGLVVTQNSGVPGSGFLVQIRGQNSIANGNDPLYIVDGVPYPSVSMASIYTSEIIGGGNPLSTLNPSDIESVSILKDADATAIYGSRGANGVILITTKHGKSGKTKVDLNFYSGAGGVDRKMPVLNTTQYLTMRNEAFKNDGQVPNVNNGDYDLLIWDTTRYTDWQKMLIGKTSSVTDVQLNISGGSANTQFSLGGGYHREGTVFPGDFSDKRATAHFNLNHVSTDNKLKIEATVNYGVENNNLPSTDFVAQALTLAPDAPPVYDSSGKLNWPQGFDNPYSYIKKTYEGTTNNLISHAVIGYTVIPSLQVRLAMGYNNISMNEFQLNPASSFNPAYNYTSGSTIFSNSNLQTWILEPQIEFQKTIGPGKLDFLVGGTAQQNIRSAETQFAYGFSSDALMKNIAAASTIRILSNTYTEYRYAAFFGRINYNIADRYIINITGRRDGSSRFGQGNQFANFGAIGAAWIFTNESFVKNSLSFLSFGKLRASYGLTGNDQIGDYQYLSTYSATSFPYQGASGLVPTSLSNPNFAWETNKKAEVGTEWGFWKDRLYLTISYYINHSSNQLVGYPLPFITGFPSVQQNLNAIVRNSGFEFSLSYTAIKSKSFTWNITGNLTLPVNKLLSFPNISATSYNYLYTVGQPLSVYKAFHYLQVDPQTGIFQFATSDGKPTYNPVFPDDLIPTKNIAAVYYGGLQNSFQYHGWKLDIFFQFAKQTGWNYFKQDYTLPGMLGNQPTQVMNRWQNPGDHTFYQKFSQTYDSAYNGFINNAVYTGDNTAGDASYLRLKTVSLSYNFPASTMSRWKIQGLRLYLQGQNLFTISNYFGVDPENQSNISLPPMRIITAGLEVIF